MVLNQPLVSVSLIVPLLQVNTWLESPWIESVVVVNPFEEIVCVENGRFRMSTTVHKCPKMSRFLM